jgi:LytS/YehU family sensor histidine kinase
LQRYLAIESLRFGDRLRVHNDIEPGALGAQTPAFALQTLVENAVRHAAAPRIAATELNIRAHCDGDALIIAVADDGDGAQLAELERGNGTGLKRLRERLAYLCGSAARLELDTALGRGFRATLRLPQRELRAAGVAYENGDD